MVFVEKTGPAHCQVVSGRKDIGQRSSFLELFRPSTKQYLFRGIIVVYVKSVDKNEQTDQNVANYDATIHERLWNNPNIVIGTRSFQTGDCQIKSQQMQCLVSKDGRALCPDKHRLIQYTFKGGFNYGCDSCALNYRPLFNGYRCTQCFLVFFCRNCVHYEISKFNHSLKSLVHPLLLNNLLHIQPLSDIIIQYLLSNPI
jgi:hypothetical protein